MVSAAELLPYPVTIADGALDRVGAIVVAATPGNRAIVLTDKTVASHYGRRVSVSLRAALGADAIVIAIPPGENMKTRESWAGLTDTLLEHGFGRDTTIVALGGGVVGDLAGFVAATYMRGVPHVQVPTTLLAMVDASVGGKTGVDTRAGKNLVGAFHQPVAVIIDPRALDTLPAEHRRAGFAEIVKHGVVADAGYFARAAAFAAQGGVASADSGDELRALIGRSIEIKAGIVARDEREAGVRKVLNFGHTIGHAVEAATDYRVLHGEAVGLGMLIEARIAERMGVAKPGTEAEIADVLEHAGLSPTLPDVPADRIIDFTKSDKKARGGRVEYALPVCIGEMAAAERGWGVRVDDTIVRGAFGS